MLNNLLINILNHPLDQFEIIVLGYYWSQSKLGIGLGVVTNLTIICGLNSLFLRIFLATFFNKTKLNVLKWVLIETYNLVKNIQKNNTSLKRKQYFTILFFLFIFILISNLVGLIPYSFTVTSSFIVTFFLAFSHYIGINFLGFFKHKWTFTNIFLPKGVPLIIAPLLTLIEFVSYIAKVLSLSIRLFANMMSGHALLKILIGFSWGLLTMGSIYTIFAVIPWLLVTIILFLEALIGFLQAYVFTILVTIYINDVLVEH